MRTDTPMPYYNLMEGEREHWHAYDANDSELAYLVVTNTLTTVWTDDNTRCLTFASPMDAADFVERYLHAKSLEVAGCYDAFGNDLSMSWEG